MKKYLTFDIGGTMIKYGLVNDQGVIIDHHLMASEAHLGGLHIISQIENIARAYLADHTLAGIGVSTAGVVDHITGTILHANENIPDYKGINIKQIVEEQFGIACEVENDVACAGLSEIYYGAAQNKEICVCLTIGTGIGCSIIIDHQVFHGANHYAGEVGYMPMNGFLFEELASTRALVRKVSGAKNIEDISGEKIFESARAGDQICESAIVEMCDNLARGISGICYVINPQAVVLGGGITAQGKYLHDILSEKLDKYLIEPIRRNTKLLFARNGNQAGMLGAYCNFCIRQGIACGAMEKGMPANDKI